MTGITMDGHVRTRGETLEGPCRSRRVSFQGPPLTRLMRGSLSVAQITMIDRRRAPGWDGQLQEYLVSVESRDGEDAVGRVLAALESHASFSAFALAER
jgi:hypothetical protein